MGSGYMSREQQHSERDDQEPGILWTWAADDLGGRGVRGVTGTRYQARLKLLAALNAMPNRAHGTIRPAQLDNWARPYPCYRYGPIVVRARRDADTGTVVIDEAEGR